MRRRKKYAKKRALHLETDETLSRLYLPLSANKQTEQSGFIHPTALVVVEHHKLGHIHAEIHREERVVEERKSGDEFGGRRGRI